MVSKMVLLAVSALQFVDAVSWWKYQAWDYELVTCWTEADCQFTAWEATDANGAVDWSVDAEVCCAIVVNYSENAYARMCVQYSLMTDIAAGTATYNPIKYVNKVFTDIGSDNSANWVTTE